MAKPERNGNRDDQRDHAERAFDLGVERAGGEQRPQRARHLGRRNDDVVVDEAEAAGELERADRADDDDEADEADAGHSAAMRAGAAPEWPSALSDSPRRRSHSRPVISPNAGIADDGANRARAASRFR